MENSYSVRSRNTKWCMRHDERKIKYCRACETHFKSRPSVHEEVYHDDEDWDWVDGDYQKAERISQHRIDRELR